MATAPDAGQDQRAFRRLGLGWCYQPPEAPVVLTFDRVSERGMETWAEVHIQLTDGGHLARRRVNLLGGTSLSGCVKELDELTASRWPWRRIVASGCESVLEAFRRGEAVETYEGEIVRPHGVRWLCDGLVMAGCVNCWVAAASTGKSTFAAALCVHHALGEPFLGREVSRGVPLYLDYESDSEDFREKLHDVASGLGIRSVPKIHRQRMRGPLKGKVNEIASRIDQYGVTLLVVDAVASAGGSMGDGNYESIAIDLEQALIALPPVTVLLLDHVTSDDLRNGSVVVKARGATRKYEFVRNQWSITLDRDAAEDHRHVVGWTHAKINRGAYQSAFGIELVHGDGHLSFREMDAVDVGPVAERMPQHRRLAALLAQTGPIEVKEAALELLGRDDERACAQIRALCTRDHGKRMVRLPDGRITARGVLTRAQHGAQQPPPNLRVLDRNNDLNKRNTVVAEGDSGDVPF